MTDVAVDQSQNEGESPKRPDQQDPLVRDSGLNLSESRFSNSADDIGLQKTSRNSFLTLSEEYLCGLQMEPNLRRLRDIVRGKVRENLRKYVSNREMIGRQGKDLVSIPIPQIDLPDFRYGSNGNGGVGQGDGEPGDAIAKGPGEAGAGEGGSEPGQHVREMDISLDELADILGEELELPRIQPRGKKNIEEEATKYTSIRTVGPESLLHRKRTYLEGLKRQISEGTYDPDDPMIIPVRSDRRVRAGDPVIKQQVNAMAIYIMDVSGSMTDDQKDTVRTTAFWVDTWLKRNYKGTETRYIIHDAAAKQVDEDTFYNTRESGGTRISSAYKVAIDLIHKEFPPSEWNIYVFQFSDGDNWGEDNQACVRMMKEEILAEDRCNVNMFCYGQVESPYGSGEYMKMLKQNFDDSYPNIALAEIADKDEIVDAIKVFFSPGR